MKSRPSLRGCPPPGELPRGVCVFSPGGSAWACGTSRRGGGGGGVFWPRDLQASGAAARPVQSTGGQSRSKLSPERSPTSPPPAGAPEAVRAGEREKLRWRLAACLRARVSPPRGGALASASRAPLARPLAAERLGPGNQARRGGEGGQAASFPPGVGESERAEGRAEEEPGLALPPRPSPREEPSFPGSGCATAGKGLSRHRQPWPYSSPGWARPRSPPRRLRPRELPPRTRVAPLQTA